MRNEIETIFSFYYDGFFTRRELHARLDAVKVRGDFVGDRYTGFDYQDQKWITWSNGRGKAGSASEIAA